MKTMTKEQEQQVDELHYRLEMLDEKEACIDDESEIERIRKKRAELRNQIKLLQQ